MPKPRLLIVESDAGTKFLLSHVLPEFYEIVGIVPDGYAAIDLAFNLEPDLVLIDTDLCRLEGVTAIKWLKNNSQIKVVIFTFNTLPQKIREMMRAGADAYCLKGISLEELKKALAIAASGGTYLSSGISKRIWGSSTHQNLNESVSLLTKTDKNTKLTSIPLAYRNKGHSSQRSAIAKKVHTRISYHRN